jgi:xanthine/uracil permease
MAEAHKHKTTSWVTVLLIVLASVVLAAALILQSIPIAVVGGILLLAGLVVGITGGIMDDAH